jgi:hypothetical protein
MLVLDQYLSSLAGLAVVIGVALLLLPLATPKSAPIRILLLGLTTLLGWRYMIWRITETVPSAVEGLTLDVIAGWTFVAIEALALVSSTTAYLFLTRRKDRHQEADRNLAWWGSNPPRVDLYIATYNEELEVLERTLAGAQAIDYPNLRVFVLDDGRREWLTEVCRRYGAEHRTRPSNEHAKAGNINYTLTQRLKDEAPRISSPSSTRTSSHTVISCAGPSPCSTIRRLASSRRRSTSSIPIRSSTISTSPPPIRTSSASSSIIWNLRATHGASRCAAEPPRWCASRLCAKSVAFRRRA